MTIHNLERLLWRLRSDNPETKYITYNSLRVAVIKELGHDERTFQKALKALKTLKWIKPYNKKKFILTNKDLE